MPSKTQAQHNLMAMVANDPKAAKRVGVPQSVGREFMKADKTKKFASGGELFRASSLPDDKTRMVPRGKLSPKRNAEIEEQRFKDVEQAYKERDMPTSEKVSRAVRQIHPLIPQHHKDIKEQEYAEKSAARQDRYRKAVEAFDEPRGRLYSDDRVHKAFKRGGTVESSFTQADKSKKFGGTKSRADVQAINKPLTNHGKSAFFSKGGSMAESKKMMQKEVAFMKAKGAPKAMVKHEQAEMKGMKKGGMPRYAAGGMVAPTKMGKVMAGGKRAHGEHTVQQKGHTKAKQVKMNRGGMC